MLLEYILYKSDILLLSLMLPLPSKFLPRFILILRLPMQMAQIFFGHIIAFKRLLFQPIQLKLLFLGQFRQLMSISVPMDGLACVLKLGSG